MSLHHEIRGGVARLQPWLDSPAGQAQLAAFLSAKTQQVQAVIREATAASESHAAAVRGLGQNLRADPHNQALKQPDANTTVLNTVSKTDAVQRIPHSPAVAHQFARR